MLSLKNQILNYSWGSKTMMSRYLKQVPSLKPEAELWIGAHPKNSSLVGNKTLNNLLHRKPELLYSSSMKHIKELPYLMKIIAAETPLSLQVHPTKKQAEEGFKKEEKQGIKFTDPKRNYKDNNHKPEMIYALSQFEALCGFRNIKEIRNIFNILGTNYKELKNFNLFIELNSILSSNKLKNAFRFIISKPQGIDELIKKCFISASKNKDKQYAEEFKVLQTLYKLYPKDPGVILSLFLNYISLKPGEAIYLTPGCIHAYLHGLGLEVMSSSDNVLRGGLTEKYIDKKELLKITNFKDMNILPFKYRMSEKNQYLLQPPCKDFQLQIIEINKDSKVNIEQNGPTIMLITKGIIRATSSRETKTLCMFDSIFIEEKEKPLTLYGLKKAQAFAVTINSKK